MTQKKSQSWRLKVFLTFVLAIPAVAIRIMGIHLDPQMSVLVFGTAVVCAAFLLTWAAEAAQKDISANFAIAILALIAVLPEYAVDMFFAYKAGTDPTYAPYAVANMTGGNRLLLGLGWPVVFFVTAWATTRFRKMTLKTIVAKTAFSLNPKRRIEWMVLAVAALYSFLIPLKSSISLVDTFVLFGIFAWYMKRIATEGVEEPDLIGVAERMASLPKKKRCSLVGTSFFLAAIFILASAEPFAEGLVETGKIWGIDEFLLVQWLAPLASESPEFIVAILLGLRLKGDHAIGTLLSSKVNQWTLLVGGIPLAYMAGGGDFAMVMDARQQEEFLLTAAQTVLGLAVLADLKFNIVEATALFLLFSIQFVLPDTHARWILSGIYLAVAAWLLLARLIKKWKAQKKKT